MNIANKLFGAFVKNGMRLYIKTTTTQMLTARSLCGFVLNNNWSSNLNNSVNNFIECWTSPNMNTFLCPRNNLLTQVAGFKVKGKLKRRCKDCYFVKRAGRLYVICPTHPRHKQMSFVPKEHMTWILTHATQSKVRPY